MPTPAISFLLTIGILFLFSKTVGILLSRVRIPSVVGEIAGGIIIGPYALGQFLNSLFHTPVMVINGEVSLFSEIAVILIIFSAAAENGMSGLRKAGFAAPLVATFGALTPMLFGIYFYLATGQHFSAALLLGAAMAATSLAVTVEVMQRMKERYETETNLILNASALDDVVSIIVLAVALTIISTGSITVEHVISVTIGTTVTWLLMLLLSVTLIPQFIKILYRLHEDTLIESASLAIAFAMSSISTIVGLTPVVGAYLGGISLGTSNAKEIASRVATVLKNSLGPLFFAVIGAELNISIFLDPAVLIGILVLTAIAVAGKVLGAFFPSLLHLRNARSALMVGVAMIPRGEVGLVIAGIALQDNLLPQSIYAEIIGMIMITTIVGPIWIQRLFERSKGD
ncbi:MAG: cation:proton antiporter [Methanomassiliicoccales archaeon]